MTQIFISYSRSDQDWVEATAAVVERSGFRTWIDTRRIPASVAWLDEIRDAIESSTLVVAFESDGFERSIHCAAELAMASELDRDVIRIPTGSSPADVTQAIGEAAELQDPEVARSIELTVRAREWIDVEGDAAVWSVGERGDPSARAVSFSPPMPPRLRRLPSRASLRRTWLRWAVISVGVFVAVVALSLDEALEVVNAETVAANESLVASMIHENHIRTELSREHLLRARAPPPARGNRGRPRRRVARPRSQHPYTR